MKRICLTAAVLASTLMMASPALSADPVTLRFASLNPPQSFLMTQFIRPWVAKLNEQGKDYFKIDIFDGLTLANNVNVYDRVIDDVVQMAWGLPSNFSRKFNNTNVVALPLIGDRSEDSSVALWRMYESGVLGAEYSDIKPLMLIALPQQGIHTRGTRIEKLEDVRGVRLNSGNKVTTDIIAALGATASSINVGEMYEAVQRGTVEGVLMPWTAFQPLRLDEVTRMHLDESFGTSPAAIFMSKKTFDALPEPARKIIEANSGEQQSREFGRIWDVEQARAREMVKGQSGHTVITLDAADRERWRQRLEGVVAEWIKSNPEGEKVLPEFRAQLTRARSERGSH